MTQNLSSAAVVIGALRVNDQLASIILFQIYARGNSLLICTKRGGGIRTESNIGFVNCPHKYFTFLHFCIQNIILELRSVNITYFSTKTSSNHHCCQFYILSDSI